MQQLWVLPNNGLGSVYSGTYQATADHVSLGDGKARLYLYIPGNGISAYEITDASYSNIEDLETDNNTSKEEFYNIHGIKIPKDNLTPGLYIKKQGNKTTKLIVK